MAKTIVYVHGDHFKPAPDVLLDISCAAIRSGLVRDLPEKAELFDAAHKDIVYYGDLGNAALQANGKTYDEQLDIADRRNALASLCEIKKQKKFNRYAYQQLPGKSAVPEFLADVTAPVLGKIGLAKPIVSRVMPLLAMYWERDGEFHQTAIARTVAKLEDAFARNDEILLIAHGLGAVVAYDALWALCHGEARSADYLSHKVAQFLTLGSPLGDASVQARLSGDKATGVNRYPANILVWNNVSAEDDYFCHDKTLADDYNDMLNLHLISAIHDFRIYNLCVRYGKSNPHSSVGYLVHPRTSRLVGDWL